MKTISEKKQKETTQTESSGLLDRYKGLGAALQERSGASLGKGQDSTHRAGKGEVPTQAGFLDVFHAEGT